MDWRTWSPFQSQNVKTICEHMTTEEKKTITVYGMHSGIIIASFHFPLIIALFFFRNYPFVIATIVLLIWIAMVFILLRHQRKGKELLCSTEWAKSQGITPEAI